MGQYYTIKSFKRGQPWQNAYGKFQSYSLSLEGLGEPVSLNRKLDDDDQVPAELEPKAGAQVYGRVEMVQSNKGTTYYKFTGEKEPDDTYTGSGAKTAPTGSYVAQESPDRQDSIYRSVALNNAATIFQGMGVSRETVTKYAEYFDEWLKNGSGAQPVEAQGTTAPGVQQEATSAAPAAEPKRQWDRVGQGEPPPEPPEDMPDLEPGDYHGN